MMSFRCLLRSETAGIGHHIKEVVLLFKSGFDAVMIPSCINMNIMNSLNTGGIVIENDNLLIVRGNFRCEESICRCFIYFLIRIYNIRADCHFAYLLQPIPIYSLLASSVLLGTNTLSV